MKAKTRVKKLPRDLHNPWGLKVSFPKLDSKADLDEDDDDDDEPDFKEKAGVGADWSESESSINDSGDEGAEKEKAKAGAKAKPASADPKAKAKSEPKAKSAAAEAKSKAIPAQSGVVLRRRGTYEYDCAPGSQAECWICRVKFKKGIWRARFQIKESPNLRDSRYVHDGCVKALPLASRERDLDTLQQFIVEATLSDKPDEEREALQNMRDAMSAPAAAPG